MPFLLRRDSLGAPSFNWFVDNERRFCYSCGLQRDTQAVLGSRTLQIGRVPYLLVAFQHVREEGSVSFHRFGRASRYSAIKSFLGVKSSTFPVLLTKLIQPSSPVRLTLRSGHGSSWSRRDCLRLRKLTGKKSVLSEFELRWLPALLTLEIILL